MKGVATLLADALTLWRSQPVVRRLAALVGFGAGLATAAAMILLAVAEAGVEIRPRPRQATEAAFIIGDAPESSRLAAFAARTAGLSIAAAAAAALLTYAAAGPTLAAPMAELTRAMGEGRRAAPPAGADLVAGAEFRELYDRYNLVVDSLESTALELQGRRMELDRANAATSRFLAVMSHELRTPLNGVLGMAQLLKATPLQDRQQDIANTILSSGGALSAVIDDVLDVAKVDAGLMELNYDLFDLDKTARRAVAEVAGLAELKRLELECEMALPPGWRCLGDAKRVRQVISKLLGNAVKFTEAGSVRLRIGQDAPFGVRIEVADTGPGVPVEQREQIFERFRQVDEADTRRHGGAGLGLSICKDVVGLMGGWIDVDEAEGGGAVFRVSLPLEHVEAAPAAPASPVAARFADIRRAS